LATPAEVFYLYEMTPPKTTPLQPYKKAVFTNRPNLSELKTGLQYLAAKNALPLN
ncbi:unnamed protein product, partial [marine sediment metagenome]